MTKVKVKNLIIRIGIFILLGVITFFIYRNIDFLNKNSGSIQGLATILLVIITGIYAYFTQKMASVMAKQVIADIKISNVILGTPFIEDKFLEDLKEEQNKFQNRFFPFKLIFNAYNKSSGSGSIEKPILILKFSNNNYEYKLISIPEKSYRGVFFEKIFDDFGGTIFLKGGEFQKLELEYNLINCPSELFTNLKENLNFLEYFIEFSDNLENKTRLKIQEIQPAEKYF